MKSKATLPQLKYDNCKDCASKCEHAGKNREFVYSGERSCKVNGIARKIDREKWETCIECKSCDNCKNRPNVVEAVFGECAQCVSMSQFSPTGFCHSCGRPLTDEAWAELERRVFK